MPERRAIALDSFITGGAPGRVGMLVSDATIRTLAQHAVGLAGGFRRRYHVAGARHRRWTIPRSNSRIGGKGCRLTNTGRL